MGGRVLTGGNKTLNQQYTNNVSKKANVIFLKWQKVRTPMRLHKHNSDHPSIDIRTAGDGEPKGRV